MTGSPFDQFTDKNQFKLSCKCYNTCPVFTSTNMT